MINDQLFLEVLLIGSRGKRYHLHPIWRNKSLKHLQDEIIKLENEINKDFEKIELKKADLQNVRKEKLQVRARIRWAEEGEKPTRYFCSLESRKRTNKTIPKIVKNDGTEVRDQKGNYSKWSKHFYADLYAYRERNNTVSVEEILVNLKDVPKLSNQEKKY